MPQARHLCLPIHQAKLDETGHAVLVAVSMGCERACAMEESAGCTLSREDGQSCATHLAKVRLRHSPFLVPDLRDQLLVTFAQGWFLVRAHQATALQEELGEWGAGLLVDSQDRKEMEGTQCY